MCGVAAGEILQKVPKRWRRTGEMADSPDTGTNRFQAIRAHAPCICVAAQLPPRLSCIFSQCSRCHHVQCASFYGGCNVFHTLTIDAGAVLHVNAILDGAVTTLYFLRFTKMAHRRQKKILIFLKRANAMQFQINAKKLLKVAKNC